MTNANESVLEDDFLLVHAYLDGELDAVDALVVGRKIAADPALSAELERAKALRQTVSELPRRTLPPHLRSRIDAAFGSKRQPARSSWQALAASTLLAFMLGGVAADHSFDRLRLVDHFPSEGAECVRTIGARVQQRIRQSLRKGVDAYECADERR